MSHVSNNVAIRAFLGKNERSKRKPRECDRFTKAELWARVQEFEARCNRAASKAETLARDAHNHAMNSVDRGFLALRDDAHAITAIARGDKPSTESES